MLSSACADRNLLFGMFALQNDHISQNQLIEAFQAWILHKDCPLETIIREKGWMTAEDIDSLNAVLDRRAAKAGGQRQLLEALPDDCGILNSLVQATGDDDVLRSTAAVHAFFLATIRPHASSDATMANFFGPGESDRKGFDTTVEPNMAESDQPSSLDETVVPPVARPDPDSETRLRFETEFTFNETVDLLGKGAFGDVFRSEEREFQRKVALKRLQNKHLAQELTPVSFLLEAEINGKLDHPGVLPMYGLGKTPSGVPFYVMKMIDAPDFGQVIEEFHGAEARPGRDPGESNQQFRKLLDHLRSVCMTVEYAHDRGVLHCDLKPANIMTGSYGETYVVDWGLALLVNPVDDWDKTRTYAPVNHPLGDVHPDRRAALHDSQGGSRYFIGGTLGYMAPEHRRAHEGSASDSLKLMTPACDVFALGVMLYQILTGKLPCAAITDEDKARQAERARTADYLPPKAVKPGVPKALSAICMKALAPDAKNRYRTTAALADDLEKWMADEPVSAYRENLAERSRRWARRNRSAVSAIAASLTFLAFGAVFFGLLQTQHARELSVERNRAIESEQRAIRNERTAIDQREIAETNSVRAEAREKMAIDAVNQYSDAVSNNEQLKNRPELDELRKQLLKSPIEFFRKLRDDLQSSNDTRPESLESLASGLVKLAGLTQEIGDYVDAKASYVQSLEIMDSLVSRQPLKIQYRSELASTLNSIGTIERTTGQLSQSRSALLRSIETWESILKSGETDGKFHSGLANSLNSLAILEATSGKTDSARSAWSRSIEILDRLIEADPMDTDSRTVQARSLGNLGILEYSTGNSNAAIAAISRSVESWEMLTKDRPADRWIRNDLQKALANLGSMRQVSGKPELARAAYSRAVEILDGLSEENPNVTQFQLELTRVLVNLSALELSTNGYEAARTALAKSIRISENLLRNNPNLVENRGRLARSLTNLGDLEKRVGNSTAARAAYERSITIHEDLVRNMPGMPQFASELGRAYGNLSSLMPETTEALARVHLAIDHQQRALRANPRDPQFRMLMLDQLNRLDGLVVALGKSREFDKALARLENLVIEFPNIPEFGSFRSRMAAGEASLLASVAGREAKDYLRAVTLAEAALKHNTADGRILKTLGIAQYRSEKYADAATTLAKSFALNEKAAIGPQPPDDLAILVMALWKLGKSNEAEATYARLVETMKRPEFARDPEARQFFREATNLMYPMSLPKDPFRYR